MNKVSEIKEKIEKAIREFEFEIIDESGSEDRGYFSTNLEDDDVKKLTSKLMNILYPAKNPIDIECKVIDVNFNIVTLNCLIDPDRRIFELRQFPKEMLQHIPDIMNKYLVLTMTYSEGQYAFYIGENEKRNFKEYKRVEKIAEEELQEQMKLLDRIENKPL